MATIQDIAKYAKVSPSTVSRILQGKAPYSEQAKQRVDEAVKALGYTQEKRHTTATIRDVAKLAGVSISTVSNVMNHHAVSQENRERVLKAAEELDYKPNIMGRNLRREDTKTIVVASSAPVPQILQGIHAAAKEFEYDIILMYTNINKREDYVNRMEKRIAEGIIFVNFLDWEFLRDLSLRYPVVQCGAYADSFNTNVVTMDYERAAYDLVNVLAEQGRKRFLFVRVSGELEDGRFNHGFADLYESGFLRALRKRRLPVSKGSVLCMSQPTFRPAYQQHEEAFAAIMADPENRPDAIIALSESMANVYVQMLQNSGLKVPEDVVVASLSEGIECFMCKPYITAVVHPDFEMGYEAVRTLVEKRMGREQGDKQVMFPHSIILRGSTNGELSPYGEKKK